MNLETELLNIKGVGPKTAEVLAAAGLRTVGDIINFLPRTYEDYSRIVKIKDLMPGKVTIKAKAENITTRRPRFRMTITEATLRDDTGAVRAVWFNQFYRQKQLETGDEFYVSGVFEFARGRYQLTNPSVEAVKDLPVQTGRVLPIYPKRAGLKPALTRKILDELRPIITMLPETLPEEMIKSQKLLPRADAMLGLHFPESKTEADEARERLAFEELFELLLASRLNKLENTKLRGFNISFDQPKIKEFVAKLPFALTSAQKRALWDILQDFELSNPMNRMLQGDVGSGKTVVAGAAAYQASLGSYQSAIMAPTEILANQHAETLEKLLSPFGVKVALLTGSVKNVARKELYKVIELGEVNVVVGTHALFQKDVKFHKLGFVVIDEQHRFGVKQRQELLAKSNIAVPEKTYLDKNTQKFLETYPRFNDGRIDYSNKKVCYVVNCTIKCGDEVLLTKRSAKVSSYPDTWSGVSGFIDNTSQTIKEILDQELMEELSAPSGYKLHIGDEMVQFDDKINKEWHVFPAVAIFNKRFQPKTNWENKSAKWMKLSEARELKLMPFYADTMEKSLKLSENHAPAMPHLLSMTATPIPRSLQLTLFGDLDISILNELPAGRKKIETKIWSPTRRADLYEKIRDQLETGRQVYVVTPLIKDSESEKISAETEFKKISKIYKKFKVGLLHGKMPSAEKDKIMRDFANHKIDVLVATTVIEVGVDVPNATVMLIENADQFGLSQLHQLRGRVGRGEHQSYCYLMMSDSSRSPRRLREIEKSNDGFYLSEVDLELRGPGEIYGTMQHGALNLQIAKLTDTKLIARAAKSTDWFVESKQDLAKYSDLRDNVSKYQRLTTLN